MPVVLVCLPIGLTLGEAVTVPFGEAWALLARPLVFGLLRNTVLLVAATSLSCGALGLFIAWCVERTDVFGRRWFALSVAAPLAIPPFVSSYAWISISPVLQGFYGAWLVVGLAYVPLVTLPVSAALREADPALEESARVLGLGGLACFSRVVLPQVWPALAGGMLLVALNTMVEFGAFTLLRFRTFTTELYAEYRTGQTGAEASLLASVLVGLCLACLVLEMRVRGRGAGRLARVGRGTRRAASVWALGAWRWPAAGVLGAYVVAAIAVPVATVGFWLTRHDAAAFSASAASGVRVLQAALASLGLGAAGAGATVALALPLGFVASRFAGRRGVAGLERLAALGQGVPGIVVALALVTLSLGVAPVLYQGAVLLVGAYAVLFVPFALVALRASFATSERGHEEAARILGLGGIGVGLRVVLPLARRGIGAAAALVFVSVVTELTVTLLLAPTGTRTLATEVWSDTSTLAFAAAAPFAGCMLALSVGSSWWLARRFGMAAG